MRLTINIFQTLNGVMQAPGGAEEDASGSFERGGWVIPLSDLDVGGIVEGWFAKAEAFLLGRNTFLMMRKYWSQVNDPDNGVGIALNGLPKYVMSRTITDPAWGDSTVISGELLAEVRRLKEREGGELQVHGSWQLAHTLHLAGLVDEYRLLIFPVCVGSGKRLFTEDGPVTGFQVVESRTTGSGVTYVALTPSEFVTASIAVEDGKEVVVS